MYVLLLSMAAVGVAGGLYAWKTSIRPHEEADRATVSHMMDIAPEAWMWLSNRKIFFGHHSVGNNILDGMHHLLATDSSVRLRIVKTDDARRIEEGVLAHAVVGRNFDPMSKIAEFENVMNSGMGEAVDIAFFKLCFVDIRRHSDPEGILAAYCEAMERLKRRYPHTVFMHATVPLEGLPSTIKGILKACIKRLIGRSLVRADNQVRARYNTLLRKRFSGTEPVFDLAYYESLGPEGQRYYRMWQGRKIPVLARMHTDDGGHLNVPGRRHLAEQLLIELARLAPVSR